MNKSSPVPRSNLCTTSRKEVLSQDVIREICAVAKDVVRDLGGNWESVVKTFICFRGS